MSDDVVNSASATAVRKRRQSERHRQRIRLERLQRLLELEDYLIEGWDFLATCGVFLAADVTETNQLCVSEGRRRAGLRFLAEHEAARPGALQLMCAAHLRRKDFA